MAEEIINRVANSKLKVIDLEDFYPKGQRVLIDLKSWLFEEFVLKEKDFRMAVSSHNWQQYQNCYVALHCSNDAIIPDWAYMLVSIELQPFAKHTIVGNLEQLETSLYQNIIQNLDLSAYTDVPVIVKGCSNKPIPLSAYIMLTQRLMTVAKSVMYGEACSAVPLFKRKSVNY